MRALVDFDGGMDMVRELDDMTFSEWFTQLEGPFEGSARGSIDRMWDPIAYAPTHHRLPHPLATCHPIVS